MFENIPQAGAADAKLQALVQEAWTEIARSKNLDLSDFDPASPLAVRLAWAEAHQLEIGGVLSRYSSKMQHSTDAQVRDCVSFGATHNIYVPPEFVCVDEAISGRKSRRDGLARISALLKSKLVRVLLVFKVSRLFRVAYLGFKFFQEDVVEENLRAISISQGIDTANKKAWRHLAYLHGIMDDMLLDTIADHVRSGLADLFRAGYVTGALTLGYKGVEVPGALTKLGKPRRMPKICEETGKLILEHFKLIDEGLPISQGWKRWVAAGGPCDARSSGRMTYPAYRRTLSNPRYTGLFAFGRTRSQWSTKRDYNQSIEQPETEVLVVRCEELRIVPEELFYSVQKRLAQLKCGPRGPKQRREPQLWDLVTDCFFCERCSGESSSIRFYQGGAGGNGMRCKHGALCPSHAIIKRQEAVRAVCAALNDLLRRDADLISHVITSAQRLDAGGRKTLQGQMAELDRKIAALGRKISDLGDLAGEGSDEDRTQMKGKIKAAQLERATKQAERSHLQLKLAADTTVISAEQIRLVMSDLTTLLENGAAGKLGEELVYPAAEVFRQLVGGRVMVKVHARPGRKQCSVSGSFVPRLLRTVKEKLGTFHSAESNSPEATTVWLRQPPRVDRLAPRVHDLIDVEKKSIQEVAEILKTEGHAISDGVIYQIYARYYEMVGQAMPKRPYNNGRLRQAKSRSTL